MLQEDMLAACVARFSANEESILKREWTDKRTGEVKTTNLTYIQIPAIINRLNEVFGVGGWSFKTGRFNVVGDEVLVKGTLEVILAGGLTTTKIAWGADAMMRSGGDEPLGNAVKGAQGDALRLCAKFLGIGAYLWSKDKGSPAPISGSTATTKTTATTGRVGIANKYAADCVKCSHLVAVGEGLTTKDNVTGKYTTTHNTCPEDEPLGFEAADDETINRLYRALASSRVPEGVRADIANALDGDAGIIHRVPLSESRKITIGTKDVVVFSVIKMHVAKELLALATDNLLPATK